MYSWLILWCHNPVIGNITNTVFYYLQQGSLFLWLHHTIAQVVSAHACVYHMLYMCCVLDAMCITYTYAYEYLPACYVSTHSASLSWTPQKLFNCDIVYALHSEYIIKYNCLEITLLCQQYNLLVITLHLQYTHYLSVNHKILMDVMIGVCTKHCSIEAIQTDIDIWLYIIAYCICVLELPQVKYLPQHVYLACFWAAWIFMVI